MPDFGLLQTPDFAQAALSGYAAGQKLGAQKRLDAALGAVDLSRPETIMPVLTASPELGAQLLTAAQKKAEGEREAAGRSALSEFLLARAKGGDQSAGAQGSPTDANGDVVVTASQQPDPRVAEEALIRADPNAWLSVQENLSKLDDNHRKAIGDAAEAQGAVAASAMRLPYAQRRDYIMSQLPYLTAHGVQAHEVESFDPTDQNLRAQSDQALGVKGILQQQNTERDDARQERVADNTIATSNARLGLARNADRRAGEARAEGRVRFRERGLDRAALASSGRLPTNTDDLDY